MAGPFLGVNLKGKKTQEEIEEISKRISEIPGVWYVKHMHSIGDEHLLAEQLASFIGHKILKNLDIT